MNSDLNDVKFPGVLRNDLDVMPVSFLVITVYHHITITYYHITTVFLFDFLNSGISNLRPVTAIVFLTVNCINVVLQNSQGAHRYVHELTSTDQLDRQPGNRQFQHASRHQRIHRQCENAV